jgi:hypothetical protein
VKLDTIKFLDRLGFYVLCDRGLIGTIMKEKFHYDREGFKIGLGKY